MRPLPAAPGIVDSDLWWMLGVTLLLVPLLFTGRKVSRLEGVVLLAAYAAYLAQLLFRESVR